MQRLRETMWRERGMLTRYFLVGGSSFLVQFLTYLLQSRVVWREGTRPIQNVIAIIASMIYNYCLHRFWTFRQQQPAKGSATRYVFVVIFWNGVSAGLFWLLHDIFHLYDLLILFFNSGVIMVMSFLTHRLFTFHHNPWKRKQDVVQ